MTARTAGNAGTTTAARTAPRWITMPGAMFKRLLKAGAPLGPNGLITIIGRKSGLPRTTPVAIIKVGDRRWVWAPWGGSHWVQNLRAAGQATVTFRGREEAVRATELDHAQRIAFFRDTLGPVARSMRLGMWFVRTVDQTDLDDPIAAADGRAVFELHALH